MSNVIKTERKREHAIERVGEVQTKIYRHKRRNIKRDIDIRTEIDGHIESDKKREGEIDGTRGREKER